MQTYVFWNGHQHKPGDWYFEGQYDLRRWIGAAAAHGLFVNLRIGPYICAEWDYGGFPVWLNWVPDLSCTRCDDPTWEREMGAFVNRIVNTTRDLFADKGGPIILAQVEEQEQEGELICKTGFRVVWCGPDVYCPLPASGCPILEHAVLPSIPLQARLPASACLLSGPAVLKSLCFA